MNPRMIGGEMPLWSDLDGSHGPGPVRGSVLEPLLATASGRTLIVGPHDAALIDAVPAADLTLLVRGVPDAEALAIRYAHRSGLEVLCGGLEKVGAESPYDTVVALDGLGRLVSVEGVELAWGHAFELLLGALHPGGRLLFGVENFFGLHRLIALRPELTDSDWVVADEYDSSRPAGLARVTARLTRAGLDVTRTYAAYPRPIAPSILLDTGILAAAADPGCAAPWGYLASMLGRSVAPLDDVLADPARLAVGALRHGTAAELAPGWILVAYNVPAGDEPIGGRPGNALPDAVIAGEEARIELRRTAEGWTRSLDGESEPVPSGRTLEDLLISACLMRDLPAIRALVGAWQSGAVAGVAPDQVIVGPDGALISLASAGQPAVALLSFARTLVGGGFAHPWPGPTDDVDLAVMLAAMAGRAYDHDVIVAAASGADRSPARPDARAFREVAATRDRLAGELADARAKLLWYEQMLTARENALKRAQRINELLSASGPARAGKALIGGARVARRSLRATVRRIRARA